jgi:phospholipase/lecithinase/hemolysin
MYLRPYSASEIVYAVGSAGTWTTRSPTAPDWSAGGYKEYAGTPGATKPTATIKTPVTFEGGQIDLFLISETGNVGGSATITVGQNGAAPSALFTGANAGLKVNNGNTAGTHDVVNTSNITTADGASMGVMIVRRISGLPAGSHEIVITINSMQASGKFDVWGYGLEATNPAQAVVLGKIAKIRNTTVYPNGNLDTLVDTWNPDIDTLAAELNATGMSVAVDDTNATLNKQAIYFWEDDIHPNERGHHRLAVARFKVIVKSFTVEQLASR